MKKSTRILIVLFFPILILMVGCGSDNSEKTDSRKERSESKSNNPFSDLKKAAEEMEKVIGGDAEVSDPVNFRDLKKFLPESFQNFDRVDAGGSTQGVMGVSVSTVEGKYENNEDGKISINIVDVGGMSMVVKGLASWTNLELDKESDDEYERTTEINGHKAYEKFNNKRKRGETAILVNDRFIVTVKGRNVNEKSIKKAINKLNFRKLNKLN